VVFGDGKKCETSQTAKRVCWFAQAKIAPNASILLASRLR
jgi:hypothetical protein